jgi:hypothetical protein
LGKDSKSRVSFGKPVFLRKDYLWCMKRSNKALPWILLVVMAVFAIARLAKKNNHPNRQQDHTRKEKPVANDPGSRTGNRDNDPNSPGNERVDRNASFNRRPQQINYSKHARCRMGCRHIDGDEVTAMLAEGTINIHKSDMRAQPDPRYAIEGTTRDGQNVRIIVAQGARTSTIVTVIDLGTDWECDCPGDERKHH